MPDGVSWSDLAGPAVRDHFAEMLATSSYVPAEPELAEVGRSLLAGATPVQPGLRTAEWTHKTLRFERGATHVRTSTAEARVAGEGVCQSHGVLGR
ncbi:hypothetical protein ACTWPT_26415 [Nonomuraea sp. 3N208]|uniref:hypothetical protein n=1 Tax=Nonomuraea sp. 3N208 TaxID=3457421 RepID=UPI003FD4F06B